MAQAPQRSIKVSEAAYRVAAKVRASRIEREPNCSLAEIATEALLDFGRSRGLLDGREDEPRRRRWKRDKKAA